ncbi:MbnP family protein [Chryseosolibacter indicus]|uniref:Copper-binding protein MbnP-like domain-containing protein n=1 Tax=Chryseosolibacter indicus TaxID=2782351 RepID=A0ABS5VUI0_9BACT|nr:MbnP family protein [Chryseosolibacter indicus]MBT1704419.1 hypothetical protein [Chryseosolibacter indicus]
MKTIYLINIILLSFLMMSCSDDDVTPGEKGSIVIEFDNRVGNTNLELYKDYINTNGETFNLTKLHYYISNIELRDINGKAFKVPQDSSYFLILEDDPESQKVRINNIPSGSYNEVTFTIGVDSLRSTMDISKRTGVLDPAQPQDGMYWSWNSGYIFFKMEGISPSAPADQENKFYYHIGGFGGYNSPTLNNIRKATISMGSARAEVKSGKVPQLHLHVDILQFFTPSITIAEHPNVMFADFSKTISANYVNMFKYDHVHN